jgi:hypothetical protein
MRHSITILLLSALAVVAASPTLPPRACTTIWPESLYSLATTFPNNTYYRQAPALVVDNTGGLFVGPDPADDMNFPHPTLRIYRVPDSESNTQFNLQYVEFAVPAGSNTCQLGITDEGNQLYPQDSQDASAASASLNILSLFPNSIIDSPTYYNVMNAAPSVISSSRWGTVKLVRGKGPWIINGFTCPPASDGQNGYAQFVIEFDPDQAGTGYHNLALPQQVPAGDSAGIQPLSGVFLTYC